MVGAIEFLRKAKAICDEQEDCNKECPIYEECGQPYCDINEADIVRKVMEYRLEDGNAERN